MIGRPSLLSLFASPAKGAPKQVGTFKQPPFVLNWPTGSFERHCSGQQLQDGCLKAGPPSLLAATTTDNDDNMYNVFFAAEFRKQAQTSGVALVLAVKS